MRTLTMASVIVVGLAGHGAAAQEAGSRPRPEIGNGERNWIIVEGVTRADRVQTYSSVQVVGPRMSMRRGDSTTLTFPEVQIDGDGWLVMHPFLDGAPNGDYVAGYTFVPSGINKNVSITLNPVPEPGAMYIVMLHRDADGDKVFDFVFTDGINVEDKAVFEGEKMIAHAIAVP